jgi:hypothetical protein
MEHFIGYHRIENPSRMKGYSRRIGAPLIHSLTFHPNNMLGFSIDQYQHLGVATCSFIRAPCVARPTVRRHAIMSFDIQIRECPERGGAFSAPTGRRKKAQGAIPGKRKPPLAPKEREEPPFSCAPSGRESPSFPRASALESFPLPLRGRETGDGSGPFHQENIRVLLDDDGC